MSNRKEAIFGMLGATSLGAIWLGALPMMGSQVQLNMLFFSNISTKDNTETLKGSCELVRLSSVRFLLLPNNVSNHVRWTKAI